MSDTSKYTVNKILKLFGSQISASAIAKAADEGRIPDYEKIGKGHGRRAWDIQDIPKIGEKYGFLKRPANPAVMAFFTTKGGVLKTTLALNVARLAALHNIKTCVVGLDMQCDITNALGFSIDENDIEDLTDGLARINQIRGLSELVMKNPPKLDSLIQNTDLPSLDFIPETPELVGLERRISVQETRREEWLKDNVIDLLKKKYDLIILDCSPNWNMLITNALIACDILISPIECKINNFRNHDAFTMFLKEFKQSAKVDFNQICVPTRYVASRKLSNEIRIAYSKTVPNCTATVIKESVHGEEATALNLSLPESAPNTSVADDMRQLVLEIWQQVLSLKGEKEVPKKKYNTSKSNERAVSA